MTYEKLCVQIIEAKEEMLKMHARPETITLSPSAFNILAEKSFNRPKFEGLEIQIGDLPGCCFVVTEREGAKYLL